MHLFHEAVNALFGSDPGLQSQANQWITEFSSKPEAWQAALSFIDPSSPSHVSFFCANVLLSKARREWSSMGSDQRTAISELVRCGVAEDGKHHSTDLMRHHIHLAAPSLSLRVEKI